MLAELYENIKKRETDYYKGIYEGSTEMEADFQLGFLNGLYYRQDTSIYAAIDKIKSSIDRGYFLNYVHCAFEYFIQNKVQERKDSIVKNKSDILNSLSIKDEYGGDYVPLMKSALCSIEYDKKDMAKLEKYSHVQRIDIIKRFFAREFDSFDETLKHSLKNPNYREDYVWFKLLEITYKFYFYVQTITAQYAQWSKDCKLNLFYLKNGTDLYTDSNFSKYGLITLNDSYELLDSMQARIYDKNLDITIFLNDVDIDLLKRFLLLKQSKIIQSIAVKPMYNCFKKGRVEYDISLEAIQFGKLFYYGDIKGICPTQLVVSNGDIFSVLTGEGELTFEELIYDFRCYESDSELNVVTQIVHLKYFKEKDNFYISHIDHEYVFYTTEEYDLRQNSNQRQKGTAHKRQKTFKIDAARIPFLKDNSPKLLLNILYTYFSNRELIDEYFARSKDPDNH